MTDKYTDNALLLLHPPLAKAAEPPAGITALAGCLHRHGVGCTLVDANLEAQLWLIESAENPVDTWSSRALKHRQKNLAALRAPATYANVDRYQRAVRDCNRVLELAAASQPGLTLTLANYEDARLDPLASSDLLSAAADYQTNLFFPWFKERLAPLIETQSPRFIGISLCYLSQAQCTFSLIGFLRDRFPQIQLLLGGGLITSWMSQPEWSNPFVGLVDHCIAGPGEAPLLALLGLDQLHQDTTPQYSGLPLTDYLAPGLILPYAASRGCYWNQCTFCPEPAEHSRYRPIAPATVIDHLSHICRQTKPSLLHLLDNAVSPALMEALCENPPGAPWYGFVRFHEQLADIDFCRRLRQSGCVLLKLGLESGSQEVLDAMHKGISIELVERVLAALKHAGIATYVYLLFGTPSESITEARQTLEFTQRHHQAINFLNLAIFNMPIGSPESLALTGKNFSGGDLSLYQDFPHPRGWDRRAIRTFLDREFKRQPEISTILRRDPPFFTSNHAAFFAPHFPWYPSGGG
ncbi:MAG: B12-binding domain-containing radical SAM protein [Desulfobulbus sp.]|nr:B12-binding domain-containing radical SAM protein [Desulfobulbus sp.]